ncbi:MAG TPA: carbohydrate-binding family 9-like protein [Thermoanaerobaculia bacterium]|nr:carbohydrate-binding family 9-like protein [Thermoanaerobaculia bacterium]
MSETLVVPRAEFSIEDPWATPRQCDPIRLRRSTDGAAPYLSTTLYAWRDDQFLSVLFSGTDDQILSHHLEHDAPLYEEDVVEVFLAPAALTEYFEIEVSPRGTVFDARITSPDGVRATMQADVAWTCEGLMAGVRRVVEANGETTVDTIIRIPFLAVAPQPPASGAEWRANFFRIDRHETRGAEYSAWQPTWKDPADFHVAAAFGTLIFA